MQTLNRYQRVLTLSLLLAGPIPLLAQSYVNPGFKLGYRFGHDGGLIYGFEVSVVRWQHNSYRGIVAAFDGTHQLLECHLGIEYGIGLIGICLGPVLSNRADETSIGFRVTPYAGVILVPYYNFQFLLPSSTQHEIGTYLKFSTRPLSF
jgi:hypothetical protein